MAMRDVIREAILAGGATKESLLELTGTTEKGLASQFTYLRMIGTCPMKQEDGTWKIVSTEEWESHRSAGGGPSGKILTVGERLERAQKKSKRVASAYDNAKKRHDEASDNRLFQLKFIMAEANFEIAEIELGMAEKAFADTPLEEVESESEVKGEDETEIISPNDVGEISEEELEILTDPGTDELQ